MGAPSCEVHNVTIHQPVAIWAERQGMRVIYSAEYASIRAARDMLHFRRLTAFTQGALFAAVEVKRAQRIVTIIATADSETMAELVLAYLRDQPDNPPSTVH